MARTDDDDRITWIRTLASIAVVTAALYLAKGILVPLTVAVLLSFLLSPVCDWLERRKLGRVPAVVGTAAMAFALFAIVAWTSVIQIRDLTPKMPEYERNIRAKARVANGYMRTTWNKIARTAKEIGPNLSTPPDATETPPGPNGPFSVRVIPEPPSPIQLFGGMFGTLLGGLGSIGVVVVLVIFFLIRREDLRDRFIRLVGHGHVTLTTKAIEDATTRVSRYLAMQLLINVTYGIPVAMGLYFIGVPNAMLWGILATVLRFIPYIGPWIAAIIPILLSMAISDSWGPPIQTVCLFLILELFSNNFMEPWMYGKNTGVSPVAVLVAAIFWSWLWGPIGLLLATPLTVCFLVIGKHVPLLSFLDVLLGDEPVFEPKKRVYQRLLAGDQDEAGEMVDELVAQSPLVEVYDTVLIPVLASIETHRLRREVDEVRCAFMFQSVRELAEDLDQRGRETGEAFADENAPSDDLNDAARPWVLCLPARSEADDIAAMMLGQVLDPLGCLVQAVSVKSRSSEMMDLVKQLPAKVVCISAAAPAATMHARAMTRRLRNRFPDLVLIVGLWGIGGGMTKARQRIGAGPDAIVVESLAEVQQQISTLMQTWSSRAERQLRVR